MKISIIIPTYNRGNIISLTLDSIKAQTYTNWECIVIDDKSTDNTKLIVSDYVNKDKRFHYIQNQRKKGAQGARNTGLFYCDSDWVFFFDSDNKLHPTCIEKLMQAIRPGIDVVQCFSKIIDVGTGETGKVFKWSNFGNIYHRLFNCETYVDFNHAIIRKAKVLEIGGLDEDCPSMQEWDTHLRLSRIANYFTVEHVLVDYYVGARDAISTDNKREIRGRLFILEKYLDIWKNHKKGLCRFVNLIYQLIEKNRDKGFKKDSLKKLKSLMSHINFYIILGFFVNKYIGLKSHFNKKI